MQQLDVLQSRLVILHVGLLAGGLMASCIEARDAESQGSSSFISGAPTTSLDFQPMAPGGAGGAGGAGGTAPIDPLGGMGGVGGTSIATAGTTADPTAGAGGMAGAAGAEATGGSAASAGAEATGGMGGAAGADPMAGTGGASAGTGASATAGTLEISFTSVGNAGEYAPRNVGAVWIETSSGMFVKTLKRWAGVRAGHLTRWNAASGGWGGGFFFATGGGSADEVDAITAATLRTHQAHTMTWDMKDLEDVVVPDGSYKIVIEVTESERKASASAAIDFEKGAAAVSLSPPNAGPHSGLMITYSP